MRHVTFIVEIFGVLITLLSSTSAFSKKRSNDTNQDFFTYFINESPKYPADYSSDISASNIPWLDVKQMEQSVYFYRRNYAGVAIMQMNALFEVLGVRSIASVIMSTKSFVDVPSAYERMMKTFMYLKLLCESGPQVLDPESNAGKTIKMIRQLHSSATWVSSNRSLATIDALKGNSIVDSTEKNLVSDESIEDLVLALRKDLAFIDTSEAPKHLEQWDYSTPVGQFDLGIVQFMFYGHSALSPRAFGAYAATEEDIKAHAHFWAVVGKLIGIEDRFNVALHLPLSQSERFYRNIIAASFKDADIRTVRLMSNMMEGLTGRFLIPTVSRFKCWLYYTLKNSVPEFQGNNIRKLFNAEDRVCLPMMRVLVGPLNLSAIHSFFTGLTFNSFLRQEYDHLGIKYHF